MPKLPCLIWTRTRRSFNNVSRGLDSFCEGLILVDNHIGADTNYRLSPHIRLVVRAPMNGPMKVMLQ
jgi:hypothetical protein